MTALLINPLVQQTALYSAAGFAAAFMGKLLIPQEVDYKEVVIATIAAGAFVLLSAAFGTQLSMTVVGASLGGSLGFFKSARKQERIFSATMGAIAGALIANYMFIFTHWQATGMAFGPNGLTTAYCPPCPPCPS